MEDLALVVTNLEEQINVLRGYTIMWFGFGVAISGYAVFTKLDNLALKNELKSIMISKNHLQTIYDVLIRKYTALKGEIPEVRIETKTIIKSMDNDTIKKLIRLCHPDKHNNSKISTEMTQLLNSLKDKR